MTRAEASAAVRSARAGEQFEILDLLRQASLPTDDLEAGTTADWWVAEEQGRLVGAVGLERHGAEGLLRSLVVRPDCRNHGLGDALVDGLETAATSAGIRRLVLLTQTATPFFARRGYVVIPRDSIVGAVANSAEFRSLCPASATCMTKVLSQSESGERDD